MSCRNYKIVQSNLGTGRIATRRGGNWTRPLRPFAAQRSVQTSASTQRQVRYINTSAS